MCGQLPPTGGARGIPPTGGVRVCTAPTARLRAASSRGPAAAAGLLSTTGRTGLMRGEVTLFMGVAGGIIDGDFGLSRPGRSDDRRYKTPQSSRRGHEFSWTKGGMPDPRGRPAVQSSRVSIRARCAPRSTTTRAGSNIADAIVLPAARRQGHNRALALRPYYPLRTGWMLRLEAAGLKIRLTAFERSHALPQLGRSVRECSRATTFPLAKVKANYRPLFCNITVEGNSLARQEEPWSRRSTSMYTPMLSSSLGPRAFWCRSSIDGV